MFACDESSDGKIVIFQMDSTAICFSRRWIQEAWRSYWTEQSSNAKGCRRYAVTRFLSRLFCSCSEEASRTVCGALRTPLT